MKLLCLNPLESTTMYLGLKTGKFNPGIEPSSPVLRADSFTTEPPGKPIMKSLM